MSAATQERLLALLCLYNGENVGEEMMPEEAYLWRDVGQDNTRKIVNTWKSVLAITRI